MFSAGFPLAENNGVGASACVRGPKLKWEVAAGLAGISSSESKKAPKAFFGAALTAPFELSFDGAAEVGGCGPNMFGPEG